MLLNISLRVEFLKNFMYITKNTNNKHLDPVRLFFIFVSKLAKILKTEDKTLSINLFYYIQYLNHIESSPKLFLQ